MLLRHLVPRGLQAPLSGGWQAHTTGRDLCILPAARKTAEPAHGWASCGEFGTTGGPRRVCGTPERGAVPTSGFSGTALKAGARPVHLSRVDRLRNGPRAHI